ncbi:MAG: hypothetical protein HYR84_11265 [Planctomycetes bacterium]|nr:hypothetical protein [Planctomycetota bacterium]
MSWWFDKAYECPACGWQGMCAPTPPLNDAPCPECGELMTPRPWWDTWGMTLLILAFVVGAVLFVAYFGGRGW